MSSYFKTRTTFYSLALAFGMSQTIVSSFTVIWVGFAPYMRIFAGITIGWSSVTWIWTSVLLSYNNRPASSHKLTRASTHFMSFIIFTVGWFALFIMLGTQLPFQCNFTTYSDGEAGFWCALGGGSFALSVLLFAFCGASALVIYRAANKVTMFGLEGNVARESSNEGCFKTVE